jgi:hypothetical protein
MTLLFRFSALLWLGLSMNFADQNITLNMLSGQFAPIYDRLYTPFAWLSGLSQPWQWTRLHGLWWIVGSAREVVVPSLLFAFFYSAVFMALSRFVRRRSLFVCLPLLLSVPYLAFALYYISVRVPPPPNPS